jgi:lipoprotein-anchoring transpeptidase ErfK/SrfK
MKHEFYIISLFLIFTGMTVGCFRFVVLQSFFTELTSDKYVQENVVAAGGGYNPTEQEYVFNNEPGQIPQNIAFNDNDYRVLGASTEPKHIVVELSKQRVYAYEGDRVVYNFLISSGKWGATPTGDYKIWYKVRSQTMKGGNPAIGTYYYLPNVQFIQYFNKGIGFHSTYWHNNFGHPMSHGCVNMTLTDAETLYKWASPVMRPGVKIFRANSEKPGTPVKVVDEWEI